VTNLTLHTSEWNTLHKKNVHILPEKSYVDNNRFDKRHSGHDITPSRPIQFVSLQLRYILSNKIKKILEGYYWKNTIGRNRMDL
jgi:hypothetical protein